MKRIALVSPVENGFQCRMLIGTLELVTVRGVYAMKYTAPDIREWQGHIDAGWVVEEYEA